jgi:hypothetical protein
MSDAVAKASKRACDTLSEHGMTAAGMDRWKKLMEKFKHLRELVWNDLKASKRVELILSKTITAANSEWKDEKVTESAFAPTAQERLEATERWLDQRLGLLSKQIAFVTQAALDNLEMSMKEMTAVKATPVAAKPVAAKPVAAKPVAAKPVAAKPVAAAAKKAAPKKAA